MISAFVVGIACGIVLSMLYSAYLNWLARKFIKGGINVLEINARTGGSRTLH